MPKINVIFMGTTQFSVAIIETLQKNTNVNLLGVICQPDKQMDRKKNYVYSPVKKYCLENNIIFYQPEAVIDIFDKLKKEEIHLIITCAYGQFIPRCILDLPTIGAYNIHASLLPKYRGGAPIHYAIINGETETGITLMKMAKKMDAGDIIFQKSCPILEDETYLTLSDKLKKVATELLEENWNLLVSKKINSIPQDEKLVTFAYNIKKEETIINFYESCKKIDQKIRGLYNKPMAIWEYNGVTIKIHQAFPTKIKSELMPGQISQINKSGIFVCTNDYDLQIIKLQLPNKPAQLVSDIINGNNIFKVNKNEKV